jgi:hypothetical protein
LGVFSQFFVIINSQNFWPIFQVAAQRPIWVGHPCTKLTCKNVKPTQKCHVSINFNLIFKTCRLEIISDTTSEIISNRVENCKYAFCNVRRLPNNTQSRNILNYICNIWLINASYYTQVILPSIYFPEIYYVNTYSSVFLNFEKY